MEVNKRKGKIKQEVTRGNYEQENRGVWIEEKNRREKDRRKNIYTKRIKEKNGGV